MWNFIELTADTSPTKQSGGRVVLTMGNINRALKTFDS